VAADELPVISSAHWSRIIPRYRRFVSAPLTSLGPREPDKMWLRTVLWFSHQKQREAIVPTVSQSSTAVTLDARVSDLSNSPTPAPHAVAFVEGSSPQITTETASLLRTRLRAAAGLLGLAFGSFLLWRFLNVGIRPTGDFLFHSLVTGTLVYAYVSLCQKCAFSLTLLRVYELAIFGLPVSYFAYSQYWTSKLLASQGLMFNDLAAWVGTIFIYAMFIPNTWRRAAVFLGTMSVLPLSLSAYLWWTDPTYAQILTAHRMFLFQTFVVMGVSFLAATYGTHVINTLRREAFEAKQLGQYRLVSLIGSGGMGDVYLAEHQLMKRPVAIKLIRPGKAADKQALARFEREVRATAKLSHWNTIEIFDYGRTEDGTFYYVMEYLPGMSLADLVERHGPLPPARAIHLLMQTCDALSEAHGRGLIHRDLKPGNIYAAQRGGYYDVAKLLDFGLAKPIATETEPVHLTQEGSITGSPLYMAPEQALGDSEPDERSDIYSLGAVAYFMLAGRPPFEGERAIKIILSHAHDAVVPPTQLRSDLPGDMEQVILRCLAKNPAERYSSASALREALAECEHAGGWSSQDAADWWKANGRADHEAEALAASAI
jgi:serine/threonine-protein kinase